MKLAQPTPAAGRLVWIETSGKIQEEEFEAGQGILSRLSGREVLLAQILAPDGKVVANIPGSLL